MEFYFQSNSVKNSLKCHKAKSATHCLTKLFPIYQNKHWTIIRWDNHTDIPSSHRLILKIVGFMMRMYLFYILGPELPMATFVYHSMVPLANGLAIMGGGNSGVGFTENVYFLTCANRNCIISLLTTAKIAHPRVNFVAIPIPDTTAECITGGKVHICVCHIILFIQFLLSYRLPVS